MKRLHFILFHSLYLILILFTFVMFIVLTMTSVCEETPDEFFESEESLSFL